MKQTVQQQKRKTFAPAMQKPRNTTHLRPGIVNRSNHSRLANDKWERQADEVATRIMRGEEGVARNITPAAAASKKVPDSRGESLARPLRETLEQRFGADFRQVRIHRDAGSNREAVAANAKAFTSGSHIYFAQGMYDPTSITGQFLLNHELTHVLQQAGRVSRHGVVRVADVSGSGDIQCVSWPSFDQLRNLHRTSGLRKPRGDNEKYKELADEIKGIVKDESDLTSDAVIQTGLVNLVDLKLPGMAAYPAEAESLLYDTLKAAGLFEKAIELLQRDDYSGAARINTLLREEIIETRWDAITDAQQVDTALIKLAATQYAWGFEMRRITHQFLFQQATKQPTNLNTRRPPYNSKDYRKVDDYIAELESELDDGNKLSENEWNLAALRFLKDLDVRQNNIFVEAENDANAASYKYDFQFKKHRIEKLKEIFTEMLADPGGRLTNKVFTERIEQQLMEVVDRGLAVFENIRIDPGQISRGLVPEHAKTATKHEQFQDRTKKLKKFFASLAKAMDDHGVEGMFPPTRETYPAKCDEYAQIISDESLSVIDEKVWKFFWLSKEGEEDVNREILMGLLATYTVAEAIVRRLRQSRSKNDLDGRNLHFINLARHARNLADELGWETIAADYGTALRPRGQTLIALEGDWKPSVRSVAGMLEDFNASSRIVGMEHLTFRQLADLLFVQYYQNLKAKLDQILPKKENFQEQVAAEIAGPKYVPAFNKAADDLKNNMPTRWQPEEDAEFALAREPAGKVDPSRPCQYLSGAKNKAHFVCALQQHPVIDAWIQKQRRLGNGILFPHQSGDGVFAWTYPAISNVTELLIGNEVLQKLVAAYLKLAGRSKKESELRENPEGWLYFLTLAIQHFSILAGKNSPEGKEAAKELEKIMQAVGGETTAEHSEAWHEFRESRNKASSLHREILVQRNIKPLLLRYQGPDRFRYWRSPEQALRLINSFIALEPDPDAAESLSKTITEKTFQDSRLQLAVLMLQIAPEMRRVFKWERRPDLLRGYLGPLRSAVSSYNDDFKKVHDVAKEFYPSRDEAWMAQRFEDLRWVHEHFETASKRFQVSSGMFADKDKNAVYSTGFGYEIPIGQPMALKGSFYTIHNLETSFEFHPAFGIEPKNPGATSSYMPKILKDPLTNANISDNQKLLQYSVTKDLSKQGTPITITITGNDERILETLSEATALHAFGMSMGNLKAGLELYVEILSWAPGIGQVIDLSRAIAAISEFFEGGDKSPYEELKRVLTGGLQEVLDDFIADAERALQPGNLIIFLLFGDPTLDALLAKANEVKNKPKKVGGKKPGKFAAAKRVIDGLRLVAVGVKNALDALQDRVQAPSQGLRGFVVSHLGVAKVFNLAESHLYLLTEITDAPALEPATKSDLGKRIDGLVATLGRLELPDRVMDIEPVIQSVMAELLRFIGKRLGVKGRIATGILDMLGVVDYVSGRIAKEVVEEGFDPNDYWRDTVKPQLRVKFDTARNDLVESLKEIMSSAHLGSPANVSAAEASSFETYDGEFNETFVEVNPEAAADDQDSEAQPYTQNGADDAVEDVKIPEIKSGRALSSVERIDLESRFGHDFGHVRIHASEQGREMYQMTGADAITSGSHIYLRPGLSMQMGSGRTILYHELAHVLQQTGARPKGEEHDARPVPGRPGIGFHFDPKQERAADRAAEAATKNERNHPVEFGVEDKQGLQPKLPYTVMGRILDELSSVDKIEKARESLDKRLDTPSERTEAKEETKELKDIIKKITSALTSPGTPTAFGSIKDDIIGQLTPGTPNLNTVAHLIASDTVEHIAERGAARNASEQKPISYVDLSDFTTKFQDYILARTGILVNYKWNLRKGEPSASQLVFHDRGVIDGNQNLKSANPVDAVEVVHIHLPFITRHGPNGKNIWDTLIDAHWNGEDKRTKARARSTLRMHLRAIGPVSGILMTSGTQFSLKKQMYKTINGLMEPGGRKVTDLPTMEDYVKWDQTKVESDSNIGVRIAKHSDASQKGAERESHHLTQYLLVEYFNNNNSKKAFPGDLDYPAGIQTNETTERVDQVQNPDGGAAIELASQNTSVRGKDMPAISLAAVTHRSGKLHVPPRKPDESESGYGTTQGQAIDFEFHSRMPALKNKHSYKKYRDAMSGTDASKNETVHRDIFNAMQGTYAWMHGEMMGRLGRNMPKLEADYYSGLRDRLSTRGPLDESERSVLEKKLNDVAKNHAVEKNDEMMAGLGWPKPG